ncbi:hypothetical protein UO65_6532 [Actinokineospora spheciospongiae]|uniref:Uncharacterized protein n=1 Tax=Actinokineospora spheciospongiae TaxID=909613 RepID=W7IW13_9PSEU|nr:Rv3235 family protein [Actinokineospora spheciospongiae]EWC58179.1 hypothetical protein UO65_6532 [Actinokineospora spheciospongiae]PWW64604.1 hypothetical protein DFQ13_103578 [Actinokineospora spheciospongiae]
MVRLSILPEYGEPEEPWSTPTPAPERAVAALARPPHGPPARDEPGPDRDTLRRLLTVLLEVFDGKRHPEQLRGAVVGPVYEALLTRWRAAGRQRHRLVSLHTCRVAPGAIELSASVRVVVPGRAQWRVRAVAGRMEAVDGQWRCVALRVLLPAR